MTDLASFYRYYFHEFSAFCFMLGACVGSFLNVCVWRLPKGESIVAPGSYCPSCKSPVKVTDNIPILSWLLLKGKCRSCHSPISPVYITVEIITALVFLFVWYRIFTKSWPLSLLVPFAFIVASAIAIIIIDYSHFIIPNVITFTGLLLAVIWGGLFPVTHRYGLINMVAYESVQRKLSSLLDGRFTLPNNLASTPSVFALWDISLGVVFGGGFLLLFGQLGKLFWGTRKTQRNDSALLTISGEGFREEKKSIVPWNRLFKCRKDNVKIYGKLLQEWSYGTRTEVTKYPRSDFFLKEVGKSRFSGTRQVGSGETLNNNLLSFPNIVDIEKEFIITRDDIQVDAKTYPLANIHLVIKSRCWVTNKEVMGMGDVKLMAMLGALLGPVAAFFIIAVASFTGTVFGLAKGLICMVLYFRGWENRIPLGPFIATASVTYIFFGEELIYFLFPI